MKHCLKFSREIFYVTIVLCLNILWLKAVNEITTRQTRTIFAKFSKKKLQHKIFNHRSRISAANFQVLYRSQNIYHSTTAYFLTPLCRSRILLRLFLKVCPQHVKWTDLKWVQQVDPVIRRVNWPCASATRLDWLQRKYTVSQKNKTPNSCP